ncbi:ROK family transcriptional regulator [Paenibacillus lautus]|uniref:ROK family transcriptional regulator n=1 Tax=Paenibacillus lautus TaxID=1401 RepID=UPI002DBCF1CE|nr:ROK family transcriptional regulator [Paenibacillus lautus]MEC0308116.1 ROK family transcriptional regulator [Paenibacillus lautus]
MKKGDHKLIQALNRSKVLNKIRTEGPISRIDLAKKNKLSPSTVASAVQELIKEGYVSEIGTGSSSGGRKPILLKFNPDNHYLFAVAITNSVMMLARMNLEARVLQKETHPLTGLQGEAVVERLQSLMDDFMTGQEDLERCVGISITVPGIVSDSQGMVHYNTKLRMTDVPMKRMVEERYGLRTWVENDMNSVVLAERRFGDYAFANLIYISIGDGLGSGILINDHLLRGKHGGAGEFGHTSINRSGIRCECGNVGCLDSYISWIAVYSRIITAIATGRPTLIQEMSGGDYSQIVPSVFKEALRRGDKLARDLNEEVAELLGAAIVNLVNMFNPEALILGGDMAHGNPELLEMVRSYIDRHALPILKEDMVFGLASLGEDEKLMGAASVLLQDLLGFSLTE